VVGAISMVGAVAAVSLVGDGREEDFVPCDFEII